MKAIEYKLLVKRQILVDGLRELVKQPVISFEDYKRLFIELETCNHLLARCRKIG